MPFMGGMEATELIRAYEMHNNLPPIPIIALTAHASVYPFHVGDDVRICDISAPFSDW